MRKSGSRNGFVPHWIQPSMTCGNRMKSCLVLALNSRSFIIHQSLVWHVINSSKESPDQDYIHSGSTLIMSLPSLDNRRQDKEE